MDYAESFADWKARNEKLTTRLIEATRDLDAEALNRHSDPAVWSPAQVVEHLVLSNRPYLQTIATALARAEKSATMPSIRLSLLGKMFSQAAGPNGNASAPRVLHPRSTPIPRDILEEWQRQQAELLCLLEQAEGKDISRLRVQNPFFPILRMNIADCFELLTSHTDRHVGQIEARVKQATLRSG